MADSASATGSTTEPTLLGIYLNDHLAGATGGLELARRTAGGTPRHRAREDADPAREGDPGGPRGLLEFMAALEVPVRQYKVASAWVAEKVGRLKLNGRLLDRSPLSSLVELETLRLGVEGKACLWRTLLVVAKHEPRLDAPRLDASAQEGDRSAGEPGGDAHGRSSGGLHPRLTVRGWARCARARSSAYA